MYKVLHRKLDPSTMEAPAKCIQCRLHLYCFPLCYQKQYAFISLSLSFQVFLHWSAHCPLVQCPFLYHLKEGNGKATGLRVQRPGFWLVVWPWPSYLQSLRWPSFICSILPVGFVISSNLSYSDMPSTLALCHQPMITSHLGSSFFSFSSSASLDLYFDAAVGAQLSLHLSDPQQSIWTPSHSCLQHELPQQGHLNQLGRTLGSPANLTASACFRKWQNPEAWAHTRSS